jgi:hypothetical protein
MFETAGVLVVTKQKNSADGVDAVSMTHLFKCPPSQLFKPTTSGNRFCYLHHGARE